MRNPLKWLPAIGLLWASCKEAVKEVKAPKLYTAAALRENTSVGAAAFNKDETAVMIIDNSTGIFNVYEVNVSDSGKKALTHSAKESYYAVDYLRGTDDFLYMHDQGGDENAHIYLQRAGDTTVRDLTPWPGSTNGFYEWNKTKTGFYFTSNKRNPKFFDLWSMDTSTWKPAMVYQNDSAYDIGAISHTGRYCALVKSITTDKNELYLYDNQAKKLLPISKGEDANWAPQVFSMNDSILYLTTNKDAEFSYLTAYDIAAGSLTKEFEDNWDVVGMDLSETGKYRRIFVNDDGKNKLLLFDNASGRQVDFPAIPDGDIQDMIISPSEKNCILTIGSSRSPSNIYVYGFDNKTLKRLTNTLNKEVNEDDLVKAEVVRFKSFDGKDIPAIFYKPLTASAQQKVPALVWVHGGPGGQSRVGFSNGIQYLVNHGYAVLAVNNRGSSGYGKTFYKLDNKDHGYGDLQDCIWGKKWLAEQNYIDSTAIGIYGGSYGGNMVLNAMTMHPDEFRVGVDLFGVTNWMRTLKSIPPYWESFRKALYDEMGDPFTADSVLLKATSPLFHYEKIRQPLLVFQGANDVRVLPVESEEIVAGAKKNGVPVEYVVYPDEGHGFAKKANQITTDEKTLEFLDKYLKAKPAAKLP